MRSVPRAIGSHSPDPAKVIEVNNSEDSRRTNISSILSVCLLIYLISKMTDDPINCSTACFYKRLFKVMERSLCHIICHQAKRAIRAKSISSTNDFHKSLNHLINGTYGKGERIKQFYISRAEFNTLTLQTGVIKEWNQNCR
jgi:hypothetical protein